MAAAHRALALLACLVATPALAQKPTQIAAGPVEAPYSLTAADGTGLRLVGLDARAVVDGPLAFTELRLTFQNPNPRRVEGHFKVTMPDGAAISRFAMKIRGSWMEGEVVEKQAARRAYEDALHRRQDPALLEQDSGNTFTARVFPIEANERKELIISWSHTLTAAGEAYRLPLMGLPSVEQLSLTAMTAAAQGGGPTSSLGGTTSRYQVSKVEKTGFTPDQDWVIYGGDIPATGDALRSDNLAVVRFVVPAAPQPEAVARAVVLFDTSASRVMDFEGRLAALRTLVNRLPEAGVQDVTVIAFDQVAEKVYEGPAKGFGDAPIARLRTRGALGASSLQVALESLEWIQGPRRAIFLTDGMVTAGEDDREALAKRIAALGRSGVTRIDAIVDTTARDAGMLDLLATSDGPRPGKVIEGRAPLDEQLGRLGKQTMADVHLAVNGAQWVWPDTVRGLQGGDAVVAFVDAPAGTPLQVSLSGGASGVVNPATREAEKPLLERSWVLARIERLENTRAKSDPDLKEALKQQIITLSTRHRVLSPYTALVVLETEGDYARFGIDRRALADILVVGATGVELMHRADLVVAQVAPPPPPPPPRRPPVKQMPRRDRGRAGNGDGARPGTRTATRAPAAAAKASEAPADDFAGGDEGMAMADAEEAERSPAPMAGAPAPTTAAAPPAEPAAPMPDPVMAAPRPARAQTEVDADEVADQPREEAKRRESRPRRVASSRPRPRPRSEPDPFPSNDRRPPPPPPTQIATGEPTGESQGRRELSEIEKGQPALIGEMAEISKEIRRGKAKSAFEKAKAWHDREPTDLLALVALGETYALTGNGLDAGRAFGSVLDLYPSRADMRRFAGNWLERLGIPGLELAADNYAKALAQRPDHPSIYHLQAMTLVRLGRYEEALDLALQGITARRANERFAAVERILQEDAQLIAAAWAAAAPDKRDLIAAKLAPHQLRIDDRNSMRFVLTWETDANDVDFHIFDKVFNHAYYSRRGLASGGELYADITTGYGPECFTIYDPRAFPYKLKAHYYSRGPMGHGAGKVQVIRHDGKGNLGIEDRPFVIMQDGAFVDLGVVKGDDAKPSKPVKAIAR